MVGRVSRSRGILSFVTLIIFYIQASIAPVSARDIEVPIGEGASSTSLIELIEEKRDHSTVIELSGGSHEEKHEEGAILFPAYAHPQASEPATITLTIDPAHFSSPHFYKKYQTLLKTLLALGPGFFNESELTAEISKDMEKTARLMAHEPAVLSIDGGGIRGLIAITILDEIEKMTGMPCYKLFDCQVGVSIGGIIACALGCPRKFNKDYQTLVAEKILKDEPDEPYSAAEVLGMFMREAHKIFGTQLRWDISQLIWGGAKWDNAALKSMLERYFGEARFTDLLTNAAAVYTDLNSKTFTVACQRKAKEDPSRNKLLAEVCLYGASAPTYFQPGEIDKTSVVLATDAAEPLSMTEKIPVADGGILMNNPVAWGIAEIMQTCDRRAHEIHVLSLGTGIVKLEETLNAYCSYSTVNWANYFICSNLNGTAFDKLARKTEKALRKSRNLENSGIYVRLQPTIPLANSETDNVTKANIQFLGKAGRETFLKYQAALEKFFAKRVGMT